MVRRGRRKNKNILVPVVSVALNGVTTFSTNVAVLPSHAQMESDLTSSEVAARMAREARSLLREGRSCAGRIVWNIIPCKQGHVAVSRNDPDAGQPVVVKDSWCCSIKEKVCVGFLLGAGLSTVLVVGLLIKEHLKTALPPTEFFYSEMNTTELAQFSDCINGIPMATDAIQRINHNQRNATFDEVAESMVALLRIAKSCFSERQACLQMQSYLPFKEATVCLPYETETESGGQEITSKLWENFCDESACVLRAKVEDFQQFKDVLGYSAEIGWFDAGYWLESWNDFYANFKNLQFFASDYNTGFQSNVPQHFTVGSGILNQMAKLNEYIKKSVVLA